MSYNQLSTGYMVVLKTPVGEYTTDEWCEFQENLCENSALQVNLEGTIVFSDEGGIDNDCGISFGTIGDSSGFRQELESLGIEILEDTILPYSCVWYNGTDSYMSELKLKQYKKNFISRGGGEAPDTRRN